MMRSSGSLLACLALLTGAACSSPEPPPPEGSSRGGITFGGTPYTINISGGALPQMASSKMGNTVLDGRDGYSVACSIKGAGQPFYGKLQSPDGTYLEVNGATAADGATFTAYMYGTSTASGSGAGTVNNLKDDACKITVIAKNGAGAPYIEPGSIWAGFQCLNLTAQNGALGQTGATDVAEFLFTGCSR